MINNLDLLGKGNLKYLAMKLDYNNYYSDREAEINNRNQGGNNYEDEYKSENENYDEQEYDKYEDENRIDDGIKSSYDEMINHSGGVEIKDFITNEYQKKYD